MKSHLTKHQSIKLPKVENTFFFNWTCTDCKQLLKPREQSEFIGEVFPMKASLIRVFQIYSLRD